MLAPRITNRIAIGGLVLFALIAQSSPAIAAELWTWNASKGKGQVTFNAVGRPALLRIHGEGAAPKGTLSLDGRKVSGICTFALDSLDTGINLRNEHMKHKYLEIKKFPEASLAITEVAFPADFNITTFKSTGDKLPFKGELELHGVKKAVTGVVTLEKNDQDLEVEAEFPLKLSEFQVKTPSYRGITVTEDVEVNVKAKAPLERQKQ